MDRPETLPTAALETGAELVLGRYRLDSRLGAGGFGVVWQAWDEKLEREVAVKVVPREADPRIEREARAAARLNHPAIVSLYELASDEREVFLVSELVRGRTMAELQRADALADRDVARIGATLCEALEHAHARGVIHRDVKPQNVVVMAEPAAGAGFAKLTDFGVAHVAATDTLTRTGDVVGTLAYMAPEQAEGARATPACDVYSLALTLYEAWSGQNPVRGEGPAATARRLGRPLPPLASYRRDLPTELCDAIDDALDPDPGRRPAPETLRRALVAAEGELAEEGGLVEPATQRRFGLTAVGRRSPGLRHGPAMPRVAARAAAGAGAGLLVLAVLELLGPAPSFSPLAAAGAAALACALLPRLGWLTAMLACCGWLASPEAGREGAALILAAACLPVPFLLPRAGLLWSLPALAPLLGSIALGPAFVGVAALAPTWPRRAGLAALGFLWLALAEVVTGESMLFGVPDGVLPRADWQESPTGAGLDALGPLLGSPALVPAAVWAVFAALPPPLVRGRFLTFDVMAAAAWAACLTAALAGLGDLLAATTALDSPRGAAAGAVCAAFLVVALASLAPPQPEPLRAEPAAAT
ncbi:MAG TPA: serine/threonine-protein kinase [Thermoleophilaceae bacterium]|nr:serine/threonine-protein kinase [Thermoleophilaceae bacterium]